MACLTCKHYMLPGYCKRHKTALSPKFVLKNDCEDHEAREPQKPIAIGETH